jgi:hypothetical protein
VSGGLRAQQMEKQTLTTVKVMPIPESVSIQFFGQRIKDDVFEPADMMVAGAKVMLSELHRWAAALKTMRA